MCVKQRLAALNFSTALMRSYALSEIYSGVSGVERSFLSLERIVPAGLPVVSVLEARHTVRMSPGGVLRRKLNFIRKQTIGLKSQIINNHCESVWSLAARYTYLKHNSTLDSDAVVEVIRNIPISFLCVNRQSSVADCRLHECRPDNRSSTPFMTRPALLGAHLSL